MDSCCCDDALFRFVCTTKPVCDFFRVRCVFCSSAADYLFRRNFKKEKLFILKANVCGQVTGRDCGGVDNLQPLSMFLFPFGSFFKVFSV